MSYRKRNTSVHKHLRVIHEKYWLLIDRHVSQEVDTGSNVKVPRVPEPKAYNGEEDPEAFERWLTSLLHWFCINRYCGPALDGDCMACVPIFLQGSALTWFNDNIDGMDHQQVTWSFKTVVIRLHNYFLHNVAVGAALNKFWSATYAPDEGVMVFYHRLMCYAVQMVRPPDRYPFKKHYMMRLSKKIFDHLLQKEVMPEEIAFQMSRYWDKHRARQATNNNTMDYTVHQSYGKTERKDDR